MELAHFDVLLALNGMTSGQGWQVSNHVCLLVCTARTPDLITRLVFTGPRIGPYMLRKAQEKEEDQERKKETVCVTVSVFESEKKRRSWPPAHAND